jgi:DNA invertase Pin-like site-specific DNA recombinase
MTKYVTYYRVSTKRQGVSGLGLEAQEATTAEYLGRLGGDLIGSYRDIESGAKDNREELQKALRECRLTGATLLIAKLDRLSRNRRFLMDLQDSSVNFICCDMPEANKLTVGILACMAEYERDLISERLKAAFKAAKARGSRLGNPNLHLYRHNDTTAATAARTAKANARNTELKEVIQELQVESSEPLSLREVADKLNMAGYTTSRGSSFKATTVNRILAA